MVNARARTVQHEVKRDCKLNSNTRGPTVCSINGNPANYQECCVAYCCLLVVMINFQDCPHTAPLQKV